MNRNALLSAVLPLMLATGPALAEGGLVISAIPIEPLAGSDVITPAEAPLSVMAALPAGPRPGLPRPSMILGDMAVLMTMAERGPMGVPFAQREAIRQRDAAMFERLLMQGAFDPEPPSASAAIQTELARMDCYSGGIDGDWGRGSAAALARYVEAGGRAPPDSAPDAGLFRALARGGDITCPPQRVVAPVAPRATQGQASRAGQPRAAATTSARRPAATQPPAARTGAPTAAPAQDSGRGINRGLMGAGVFR